MTVWLKCQLPIIAKTDVESGHLYITRMSDQLKAFEEFLATQSAQIPLWAFAVNLILAAILGRLLGVFYTRFGSSLSNRRSFGGNFMILAMTTMLIISIVKSSIALSLGLVGALSIVRFRAAIKEPEELTYLFLTIGIGLGLGADQRAVTLVAFVLILVAMWTRSRGDRQNDEKNLFLTVSKASGSEVNLDSIVAVLRKYCSEVDIRRFDEGPNGIEATFHVRFDSFSELDESRGKLRALDPAIQVSFLDNRGFGNIV
jgi:uncharacterized membrane protein YhiD involved in acid resistance